MSAWRSKLFPMLLALVAFSFVAAPGASAATSGGHHPHHHRHHRHHHRA
jgi:Ni/Co efflux regulator RcnB